MDPDTYLSQFIALFDHIEVYPPDLGATIALVLSVLLLGCSGFVSASEIAFFSLSPTDVGKIEENRHAADSKILELKEDSHRERRSLVAPFPECGQLQQFRECGYHHVAEFLFQ